LVGDKFATATPWIQEVALSDMASYTDAGEKISNPVFPFKIIFKPHSSVSSIIPDSSPSDGMEYVKQLRDMIPANSVIYDVYGLDKPPQMGGKEVAMGTLQLNGKLSPSVFGD